MDRLDQLRVFVRVAELSGFSRAAVDLGLPRATVSAAVAQLETSLGQRLLARTTRQVRLTPDGESLLLRARALLADYEAIATPSASLQTREAPVSGRLRVDLPGRISRLIVLPALPALLARHPGLEIDLGASDRIVDLVEAGIDCAVRVGPLASSSLVARPLGQFELVNCASPAYLTEHGRPLSVEALTAPPHWVIGYRSQRGSPRRQQTVWDDVDADGQPRQRPVRCRVSVHDAETYIAAACAGLGLVQVPWFDVRALVAADELRLLLPQARPAPVPVHLVVPHRRHLTARVRVFADWMAGLLAEGLRAAPH
jgi:LysR family transcriptional regulator for bpeEF and oprC